MNALDWSLIAIAVAVSAKPLLMLYRLLRPKH